MQVALQKPQMRAAQPFRASQRCAVAARPRAQRVVLARAEEQPGQAPGSAEVPASTSAPAAAAPAAPAAPTAPVLLKGQGTAIITGAISIIFGIAYFALQIFMDSRGGQLLPPPPEAYIP
jgi:hypothetical protein